MQPFIKLKAIAAPMELNNVDTDMIIPKEFLKTIKRTGLGKNLFHEMRYDIDGNEVADFILNQVGYKNAQILVTGDNFGCGSSREHAPWALLDFGIRCIISTSFADIFYNNCFKNSILPIKLEKQQVEEIMDLAKSSPDNEVTVDLEEQKILVGEKLYNFQIEEFRKNCLLKGLDDIALTMQYEKEIKAFENKQRAEAPWLYKEMSINENSSH